MDVMPPPDDRFKTADGCREMAQEFGLRERNALLVANRHRGWRLALLSRAEQLDQSETP